MTTPPATGLVLVGHGSAHHAAAGAPLFALADEIRRRRRFAEVVPLFLRQPPRLGPLAALTTAPLVHVVPVLAGGGAFAGRHLLAQAGLDGPLTRIGERRFILTDPVGAHSRFAALVAAAGAAAAAAAGLASSAITLLVIAHGSSRPGGAGNVAQAIAATIAATGRFAAVTALFLDQSPRAVDWPAYADDRPVVAVPLLLSSGHHARHDLPMLFCGHESGAILAGAVADAADLAEIVLDLVDGIP